MNASELIEKKRNGFTLYQAEIEWIINGYVNGTIPDYQMSAFLMAVFFKGMSMDETINLTMTMARSGSIIDLSDIDGIKIDKHSTGGVADTTTLIVAPLVAAAGVKVAKMSGRGLGFTGGTIDKLESIPGFNTTLTLEHFKRQLTNINIAVTGQTSDIAPADGKIYALRDVTATVESIPLIASSIMSKKIAAGADKILLDVKVGKGAFMKSFKDAVSLAETMVNIGQEVGKETIAVITTMDEPLGSAVGNSIEVLEALDVLSGKGPESLRRLCLILGAYMLLLAGKASNLNEAVFRLENLLTTGAALDKFQQFVTAQGGPAELINRPHIMQKSRYQQKLISNKSGYITKVDAEKIGIAAMRAGAGREVKGASIDLTAGIMLKVRVGEYILAGQLLAEIYGNDAEKVDSVVELTSNAIEINDDKTLVNKNPLFYGIVDKNGFKTADGLLVGE